MPITRESPTYCKCGFQSRLCQCPRVTSQQRSEFRKQDRVLRKKQTQSIFKMANPPALDSIQTSSESEQKFVRKAKDKGWRVLKNGWPDFLLFRKSVDGQIEIQAVEVKQVHGDDPLRECQKLMLSLLTILGIPCYVWSSESHGLRLVDITTAKDNLARLISHLDSSEIAAGIKTAQSIGSRLTWY